MNHEIGSHQEKPSSYEFAVQRGVNIVKKSIIVYIQKISVF